MFSLQDAVTQFAASLETWTADLQFRVPCDNEQDEPSYAAPNIYQGGLPIRVAGLDEVSMAKFYPAIIVRFNSGEIHAEDASGMMQIDLGTWDDCPSMAGYADILTLTQHVYTSILSANVIADAYRVRLPVKYSIEPADKCFPFFEASITFGIDFPAIWPLDARLDSDLLTRSILS